MKPIRKLALAAALGAASLGANASDLVFDFAGSVDFVFDPVAHDQQVIDDYTAFFTEDPAFATFTGKLVLPDYEQYLSGTHTIELNSAGLELSLVSGLLGGLEGTGENVTMPNPDYVEGVENCTGHAILAGCDFDGDGTLETPYNNNPETLRLGEVIVPTDTQIGDSGSLTLVDGMVNSFEWFAGSTNEGVIGSYNSRFFDDQGWNTRLEEISVSVVGSSSPVQLGEDVYFSANPFGTATVSMVPEAESYAMLLAGLGVMGAIARRRRKTA